VRRRYFLGGPSRAGPNQSSPVPFGQSPDGRRSPSSRLSGRRGFLRRPAQWGWHGPPGGGPPPATSQPCPSGGRGVFDCCAARPGRREHREAPSPVGPRKRVEAEKATNLPGAPSPSRFLARGGWAARPAPPKRGSRASFYPRAASPYRRGFRTTTRRHCAPRRGWRWKRPAGQARGSLPARVELDVEDVEGPWRAGPQHELRSELANGRTRTSRGASELWPAPWADQVAPRAFARGHGSRGGAAQGKRKRSEGARARARPRPAAFGAAQSAKRSAPPWASSTTKKRRRLAARRSLAPCRPSRRVSECPARRATPGQVSELSWKLVDVAGGAGWPARGRWQRFAASGRDNLGVRPRTRRAERCRRPRARMAGAPDQKVQPRVDGNRSAARRRAAGPSSCQRSPAAEERTVAPRRGACGFGVGQALRRLKPRSGSAPG